MKKFLILFLSLLCLPAWAANPSFTDFDSTQHGVTGNKVVIKGGALVTNLVIKGTSPLRTSFSTTNGVATGLTDGSDNLLFIAGGGGLAGGDLRNSSHATNNSSESFVGGSFQSASNVSVRAFYGSHVGVNLEQATNISAQATLGSFLGVYGQLAINSSLYSGLESHVGLDIQSASNIVANAESSVLIVNANSTTNVTLNATNSVVVGTPTNGFSGAFDHQLAVIRADGSVGVALLGTSARDGSNLTNVTANGGGTVSNSAALTSGQFVIGQGAGAVATTLNGNALTNLNGTNLVGTITNNTTGNAATATSATTATTATLANNLTAGITLNPINAAAATNLTAGNLAAGGTFPAENGSALTALNASQLTSGTVADARISSNVPFINGTNTFTGSNVFTAGARTFRHDNSVTLITNTANLTGTEFSGGHRKDWYNGVSTITADKTNGWMSLSGAFTNSGYSSTATNYSTKLRVGGAAESANAVEVTGTINSSSIISSLSHISAGGGAAIYWAGRSAIHSQIHGKVNMTDTTDLSFTHLTFGPGTLVATMNLSTNYPSLYMDTTTNNPALWVQTGTNTSRALAGSLGASNITAVGFVLSTNGIASFTATSGAISSTSNWTNTTAINVHAYVNATTFALKNASATTIHDFTTSAATATATVYLQPGWYLTGTAIVGDYGP